MKILVIEDELSLLSSIQEYFKQEEFYCEGVATYKDAIYRIEDFSYDCIILDINLPDGNGLKLLQFLRENKQADGVIIISARDSVDDRINGLELGADDYLTKPFHLSELNARVKALLRRKYAKGNDILEIEGLCIDLFSRSVFYRSKRIMLTKNEFNLLAYLINNKNRVVSRQAIAEHIYGNETESMPSFDFVYYQMKNLKRKLKENGCKDVIETVYGLGYKFTV
ncbi:MAG: DNA-binding response regulator [Sphingobacteriia bacterium 24-36-13]|jgi:DNA-binding response OmpR family regulator|uniref:response regulator transcription factor n=1 Tax=Chitinophagaceae TaxID=563835 RepID=UPI000BDDE63A|nr:MULTISPECIES: response regulator transcription factor [Chitinophagaceae]OYZ55329.1 MAG: DNA-binding response regulator [Sphingobacteriia bacterium 24-36-13]OZA66289.1 MAG: DNA-binding response regulator [Sphingobacteriia bacterium 39-36-14]RWZ89444.1 MAG: response regulator transcription factor [Hydrotalea sp. AMD]HQS22867.1 response regulator transcription factor [Sediminibacterium sp.]HQS33956.1 response regulator transcription factor [Sediminibacterium sp.]